MNYLDGNAAAGMLGEIFAVDVTAAEGTCAFCGTTRHFAQTQVYMQAPGLVARCGVCGHVVLRAVRAGTRTILDLRGMSSLCFYDDK